MAASTYFAQVQQLYIAYFGRPADTIGLNFWATQIDAANGSIAAVQAGFSASTESQALFGNKSTIDKVTAIYQNAFGRAPEPAGLAFWVAQLDSGKVTQAQASWTIQQSAGAGDAAVVQAKLVAAQAFTAQIDTTAEIVGYQGTGAADAGRAFLATVVSAATGATAVTNAPTALATAVAAGGTGSNFVLTTGVDNLTGSSSNDIFTADNTGATAQLGAADSINGGAGVDTLRIFQGAAATAIATPTLTNVENVLINGGAVITGGYTAIAGTTGLIIEAPAVLGTTYTVAGQAVTLKGSALAGTTTIASTADTAANVTLNGWTGSTVDLAGTKVATATLTATGANSSITLTDTGLALKTLNITGDRGLTVVTPAGLTSVNASTATGAVSVDGSANAAVAAFAFTGGAGNDKLTLAAGDLATLTAGTQLDGGAGTDTLAVKDVSFDAAAYAKLNAVKGFEVLALASTATTTIDAAQLTTIKSFSVANATVATVETINNLGAGSSVAITGATTAVALGAALGNSTTDITLGAATTAGFITGSLTTTGLTNLSLTSNGTSANTITTLANSDNSTITVKGAADLTITNALAGATTGSKVDASAFTGKLNITGSTKSDIIIGGSGDDTINGGTGAVSDTLTGGAGKDKFVIVSGNAAATADVITDFVTKVDTITFGGAAGSTINYTAATSVAASFDAALLAANAVLTGTGGTTSQYNAQQVGADTYVFFNDGVASGADQIVKLSGVALANVTATDIVAA